MDAIVLVGGEGKRLRPLTATRHKSLVPVCNRPVLSILLSWLAEGGVTRAILALGQKGEELIAAAGRPGFSTLPVVPVVERERLESGGAIRNAVREASVQGRFVVVNGDIFPGFPLSHVLADHERHSAELTIALVPVKDPTGFGVAEIGENQRIVRFVEKPLRGTRLGSLVNAGVWIFEPGLVDEIPAGAVRVEETLFPALVAAGRRIIGSVCEGVWADLGTPERYLALHRLLLGERNAIAARVTVAPGSVVARSAVGEGSRVGPGARVEGSVLWENVEVGPGAAIFDSIVAEDVVIEAKAVLRGCVVGAGARVAAGAVVLRRTLERGERYDGRDEA